MPLRLTLRAKTSVPLEVEDITPDTVRGKSLAEIENLEIFEGNVKTRLAEFFAVSGDPADEFHEWEGDLAGINMLAGNIFLFGDSGIRHGAGMKRGTIAFLGKNAPPLLPTFRRACRYRPEIMPLIFRHLRRLDFAVNEDLLNCPYDLY